MLGHISKKEKNKWKICWLYSEIDFRNFSPFQILVDVVFWPKCRDAVKCIAAAFSLFHRHDLLEAVWTETRVAFAAEKLGRRRRGVGNRGLWRGVGVAPGCGWRHDRRRNVAEAGRDVVVEVDDAGKGRRVDVEIVWVLPVVGRRLKTVSLDLHGDLERLRSGYEKNVKCWEERKLNWSTSF